jgi:hypothetical protein
MSPIIVMFGLVCHTWLQAPLIVGFTLELVYTALLCCWGCLGLASPNEVPTWPVGADCGGGASGPPTNPLGRLMGALREQPLTLARINS